ncbi:MAG TPA: isoaspartyl peptidase/L-asparaginase [Pirellulaceae bacterium]|nr:isoaspartyl peptidase/L-asparaginase [Pirellulaceae bacterium]
MARFPGCNCSLFLAGAKSLAILGLALLGPLSSFSQEVREGLPEEQTRMRYAIVLHGGAGTAPRQYSAEANQNRRQSLEQALRLGVGILDRGGTALEAVEAVVVFLEDDPQFNAGIGAVFNSVGSHELDAAIMDGSNLACGAVAGVSRVKNPISLARMVMKETRHVFLIGDGAETFAEEQGIELVDPSVFDTPRTREAWERRRRRDRTADDGGDKISIDDVGVYHGTVGCVALDAHGNLAAATSTGGISNKKYGRVGDTPIIGAGTYADNQTCAVSCTGTGEEFIRYAVAYDIAARMKYANADVVAAVKEVLDNRLKRNDGGIIAVSQGGQMTAQFNTVGMASAMADSSGLFQVNWDDQ